MAAKQPRRRRRPPPPPPPPLPRARAPRSTAPAGPRAPAPSQADSLRGPARGIPEPGTRRSPPPIKTSRIPGSQRNVLAALFVSQDKLRSLREPGTQRPPPPRARAEERLTRMRARPRASAGLHEPGAAEATKVQLQGAPRVFGKPRNGCRAPVVRAYARGRLRFCGRRPENGALGSMRPLSSSPGSLLPSLCVFTA